MLDTPIPSPRAWQGPTLARDRYLMPIPAPVLAELLGGLDQDHPPGSERRSQPPARGVCRGPLLSRAQYLPDIDWWGYQDARLQPAGPLTAEEIAHWTAAIERPA